MQQTHKRPSVSPRATSILTRPTLFTEVSRGVDQQLWPVESHRALK